MAGIVEKRNIQRAMIGKTEGEGPLPRPRGKRGIKINLSFGYGRLRCGVDLSSDMENWRE